ncbi:MAG: zinc ribbon domain-containing protein [Acidimicrobiia bacterium]
MSNPLETLLVVQEHDLALDRLQHRRDTLPERDALAAVTARATLLAARTDSVTAERDVLGREEARLDDEARTLEARAKDVEAKMYSGEVTSPRELQAMQADVDQLQRHRRDVEGRELEIMEQREPFDAELATLGEHRAELTTQSERLAATLAEAERAIDAEMHVERDARDALTADLDTALLATYEQRRATARGAGIARLVGTICQGCHLMIPSTEAERIKRAPVGSLASCDNCGCILVP